MKTYDELFALITERGVHEVFGSYGEGYGIEQNPDELARFLVEMQALGIQSALEVGTGYKAGLARFLHDDLGYRVTSVDIQNYGHPFGGIDFVHPRDFDHDAVDEAYDLVLIDADHSYQGVKDDHEFYAKYATKVIAFHDIAGLRECQGVQQYWWQIADEERPGPPGLKPGYHEIIADTEQRGGIGYAVLSEVAVPKPEPEQLLTPETIAKLKAHKLFQEDDTPAKKSVTPRKRTPAKKPAVKK